MKTSLCSDHDQIMEIHREAIDTTIIQVRNKYFSSDHDQEMEIHGETIATTLTRDENGLGFSIAGGRGSIPFKGEDDVSIGLYK